jgi:hypothetical protein
MRKPNKSFYVSILVIISVFAYIIVAKIRLKKDGILLNAKTIDWAIGSKMSLNLKYEFYYNGERVTGASPLSKIRGNPDFENRYFPVMYYPKMGGHSQLLVQPSDFEKFNLPFPDSLKWVLSYLED